MTTRRSFVLSLPAVAASWHSFSNPLRLAQAAEPAPAPAKAPTVDAVERRAVEAAIWGMPIASFHALRESFVRDAGAKPQDIVYLSRPADWKLQVPTPNATTYYAMVMFSTIKGPIVFEVPGSAGASLFGSLNDAWHRPLVDVGPNGEDKGNGGKYLLLPPGYAEPVPPGYIPVHLTTFNSYSGIRATPDEINDAGVRAALAMVKSLRQYPLADKGNPPAQKYVDMAGRLWNGIAVLDDTIFDRIAKMVDEEPVQPRDMVALHMLATLGIKKGKPFTPDAATRELLRKSARTAFAEFLSIGERLPFFNKGSLWRVPFDLVVGTDTGFTYEVDGRLDIDNRGQAFREVFAPPAGLGGATFYLGTTRDTNGNPLVGDKSYRLHVPPNVPAEQFWAVTVYSEETAAFIRESPRVEANSFEQLKVNEDGSVDIYFSAKPPGANRLNWVYVKPGERWFPYFRWYGPKPALFEKTWVLPDVEEVK